MGFALGIDHYNIRAERDELHPLCHVVGPYPFDHEMVPLLQQGKSDGLPQHVDIHAQRAVQGGFLQVLGYRCCRIDLMLIPE